MPRHVAYILATLAQPLAKVIPWYRVVPEGGKLCGPKHVPRMKSLVAEAIEFCGSNEIAHFAEKYVAPTDLTSGVSKQYRGKAGVVSGKH